MNIGLLAILFKYSFRGGPICAICHEWSLGAGGVIALADMKNEVSFARFVISIVSIVALGGDHNIFSQKWSVRSRWAGARNL